MLAYGGLILPGQKAEALELLKRVDEARSQLAGLKRTAMPVGPTGEDTRSEIRQLEVFIAASSRQAEQAITERFRERTNADSRLISRF